MKYTLITCLLSIMAIHSTKAQKFSVVTMRDPGSKFSYTMVKNDPLKVRTYVLPNGLTVMISVNKKEPRVQTMIATKAGSKNDPAENTGLAHYLEHMLFKGTDKYGSKNWAKEKVELDKIDALYEKYNKTTDPELRKTIYHEIDSVSGEASKYAIANEYDKMMSALGAQGTNAFTSLEQTVYVNEIPQNNMEKWLTVEAERFRNPILRLFHTELEAVYEEKNISLDNDGRKVYEALLSNLFRKHPYGTQTTIGTVEHLKNPSLIKIRNYYNSWYVPNNMAIVLAGDLDPEKTMQWISSKFAYMKSKPVPVFKYDPEILREKPTEVEVLGPDAENIMIGYRLPGMYDVKTNRLLMVVDALLSNSKAGFIDLNLTKKQKVLSAGSSFWTNKDYSIEFLTGKPLAGQSLEQLRDLLLEQIDKITNGEFDEELLQAVIANLRVSKIEELKTNSNRANVMLDAFTLDRKWEDVAADMDEMAKTTRADVMDFCRKYFTSDRLVIYKRKGVDKSVTKITKPEIHPVEVNRDDQSAFVKNILANKSPDIKPVYIDFKKAIVEDKINNIPFSYIKNNDNELFNLYYMFDMGRLNDLYFAFAMNLLPYLGTQKYTAEEISIEFYKMACEFNVNVGEDQTYIQIKGLSRNMERALAFFDMLVRDIKSDPDALKAMVERTLKQRADNKLSKNVVFRRALVSYAMYGKDNPFTYMISENELKMMDSDKILSQIQNMFNYKHKIFYFGPETKEKVSAIVAQNHKASKILSAVPEARKFTRLETEHNRVYFVPYNMVQAEIMWVNKAINNFDSTKSAFVALGNEYFGGGMSGLVFQTIRESKALAYSTYSHFQQPSRYADPSYIFAYVGTQADKMNEAIPAMNELLNKLPRTDQNFTSAKIAVCNKIETERINDEEIYFRWQQLQKLGIDHDSRRELYDRVKKMKFEDMEEFFRQYYYGKPYHYAVMASKDRIDVKELKNYGELTEVSLEEIFGY